MKTFRQFQESLIPIKDILKKIKKDIKNKPDDKPYIQEPVGSPNKV